MGCRAITRAFAFAMLVSPLAAQAAFFQSGEGRSFLPRDAISYRPDNGSAFEQIAVDKTGWISQRDKPFVAGTGPVRIWAKFDLPHATPTRRALLGVGPWEHVEYFVVTDGRLVDRQTVGEDEVEGSGG